jgi:hypothetical protein
VTVFFEMRGCRLVRANGGEIDQMMPIVIEPRKPRIAEIPLSIQEPEFMTDQGDGA